MVFFSAKYTRNKVIEAINPRTKNHASSAIDDLLPKKVKYIHNKSTDKKIRNKTGKNNLTNKYTFPLRTQRTKSFQYFSAASFNRRLDNSVSKFENIFIQNIQLNVLIHISITVVSTKVKKNKEQYLLIFYSPIISTYSKSFKKRTSSYYRLVSP